MTIILKPGDFVSIRGISTEQYHQVAQKFMESGAEKGEYPDTVEMRRMFYFGWHVGDNILFHAKMKTEYSFSGKEYSVSEILGLDKAPLLVWDNEDTIPPVGCLIQNRMEDEIVEVMCHGRNGRVCVRDEEGNIGIFHFSDFHSTHGRRSLC